MIFRINEKEDVQLIYSFRSAIFFEQITNKPINLSDFNVEDLLYLYYSVVIASLQKAKKPIISLLEFMDAIDDYNGGEKSVVDFSNWYVDVIKKQYDVIEDMKANEKEVKPKKESKKKS